MKAADQFGICDDATISEVEIHSVSLDGVCCMFSQFSKCSIQHTSFYWAIAMGSTFNGCQISFVDFRGADLKETSFKGSKLIKVDFGTDALGGSTSLQGADLSEASLRDCNFQGAHFDSLTKFPKGFHPEKHGLRKVSEG